MIDRIPEPELMQDPQQVQTYAQADFAQAHNRFIDLIEQHQVQHLADPVLDLGCGPGDVTLRFARRFNDLAIDAIDGSKPMLAYAKAHLPSPLAQRVHYLYGHLPDEQFSSLRYQTIISNSLLHHLADADVLWQTIKHYAVPGAAVYIMDLLRPDTQAQAHQLVTTYAAEEEDILQTDFYNSLLAAYTLTEVRGQLQEAGLTFSVKAISDRHLFIYGKV